MPFDLRDALRGLRRDPGYTATTILTLALTIGATTAIFSIINGVLLRPLAYRESHQLVALREVFVEIADRYPVLPLNGRHFGEWQNQSQTFAALAEYMPLSSNLTGTGDAAQISLVKTSGGLFDVLQVAPILGRGLRPDDERGDAPDVAVIGHALWRDRFGADPAVVGKAITLDGKPHTVVGVLPPGFQLPARRSADRRLRVDDQGRRDRAAPSSDGPGLGRRLQLRRDWPAQERCLSRTGPSRPERDSKPDRRARQRGSWPAGDDARARHPPHRGCRRRRTPRPRAADGRDRRRAVDRLRQPRQPLADARDGPDPRRDDQDRPWRQPRAPGGPAVDRAADCRRRRRRAGDARRARLAPDLRAHRADRPAARRRGDASTAG